MTHQDDTVPFDPSERPADAGPPLDAPSFDARSVRRARAAVPLEGGRGESKLPWVAVALVAGMLGGLLGIWTLSYYQGADDTPRPAPSAPSPAATDARPDANASQTAAPADPAQPQADAADGTAQTAADAEGDGTAAQNEPEESGGASPASVAESEELRGALAGWVEATNARDINRQMSFYGPRVETFYLTRNASREAVRAEKAGAFARATTVEVRADRPQIFLSRDGRTATMRFRKQYAVEGGGADRRGAVLQELRWRRTPQGWKIVGERDLRVLD